MKKTNKLLKGICLAGVSSLIGGFILATDVFASETTGNNDGTITQNVVIDETNFPDEVFRNYVSKEFDTNEDGELSQSEIETVTELEGVFFKNVSFEGIEYFTNIEYISLSCIKGNPIDKLDLRSLKNLTYLECSYSEINELNVNGLENLTYLEASCSEINKLNVSGLNNLETLIFDKSVINELYINDLENLTELDCSETKIKQLDVSEFKNLTDLKCYRCSLSELNVGTLEKLTYLDCSYNDISESDLSSLKNLTYLDCSYNGRSELNVSNLKNLTYLDCSHNEISELDVSNLKNLTYLDCSHNEISELDVSNLKNLTDLDCESNSLSEIDLGALENLTYLCCYSNEISELDVSNLKNLTDLDCGCNSLNELNLNGLEKLTKLYCYGNEMSELNVSGLESLTKLWCSKNEISELDVSNLKNLTYLDCSENSLNELNVNGLENLKELRCGHNNLTMLNVDDLKNLTFLDCSNNSINELNISGLEKLTTLWCDSNEISELDVSKLKDIEILHCSHNSLSELKLNGLSNLLAIDCSFNNISELDVSDSLSLIILDCANNNISDIDISMLNELIYFIFLDRPIITSVSNDPSGVVIKWSAVEGAEQYAIYRSDSEGYRRLVTTINDGNTEEYIDTTVEKGIKYKYYMCAYSDFGNSIESDFKEIIYTDYIEAPVLTSASNTSAGVTLKWSSVSGAEGYEIYRKTSGGSYAKIKTITGTSTITYTDTTAKSGTTYYYAIKAVNSSTESELSNDKGIIHLAKTDINISNGSNGVNIKWSKVTGATGYNVYRKTLSGEWTKIKTITDVNTLSCTDTTAKSGTTYYYTVKAYKDSYEAIKATEIGIKYLAKTNVKISNGTSSIVIKWDKVTGATGYNVYRKSPTGKWTKIKIINDVNTLSYSDTTAQAGKTYYYMVRAYNGSYEAIKSDDRGIKRLTKTTINVSNGAGGVTLKWGKITGADGYNIYRKTSNGQWTKIKYVKGIDSLTYTDTSAKSGTTYYYTVKAYSNSSEAIKADEKGTKYLARTTVTGISATSKGATIKWNKVNAASGYYVYRKTSTGSWSKIKTITNVNTLSYTDTTAKKGITYYYSVRAYNGSFMSSMAPAKTIKLQ